jgi:hypothetical protein
MTRPAPSRAIPATPAATAPVRQADTVASLKAFSLYAMPGSETATSLAARRALMSRKGVSVEEISLRARERRHAASQIQRFDRRARLLALLVPAAAALAWVGSIQNSLPTLLAGYVVLALAAVALIARLTRTPDAARLPLEQYYLPDEQLASAEDISLLRRLAQQDPELDVVTTAWWRSTAPIRKGDIRLALDFQRAKRG